MGWVDYMGGRSVLWTLRVLVYIKLKEMQTQYAQETFVMP